MFAIQFLEFKKAGLGGPTGDLRMVKIEFDVVFDKGESQLPDDFYPIRNKANPGPKTNFLKDGWIKIVGEDRF